MALGDWYSPLCWDEKLAGVISPSRIIAAW